MLRVIVTSVAPIANLLISPSKLKKEISWEDLRTVAGTGRK